MTYRPDIYDVLCVRLFCPLYVDVVAGRLGLTPDDAAHALVVFCCYTNRTLFEAAKGLKGFGNNNRIPRLTRLGRIRWVRRAKL